MDIHGADFAVSDENRIIPAGWIWNFPNAARGEAEASINRIQQRDDFVPAEYVMLLSQARAFVWHRVPAGNRDFEFAAEIPVKDVFDFYFGTPNPGKRIRGINLQTAALDWLGTISERPFPGTVGTEAKVVSEQIGLAQAIEGHAAMAITS